MTFIELTALRPDLPISAMAAFAVLRLTTLSKRLGRCRLGWAESHGEFRPLLETEAEVTSDDLIDILIEKICEVPDREALAWTEQLKGETRDRFREIAGSLLAKARADDRAEIDWIAAIANELVTDEEKIEPTPFDMSVARQKFPGDARKLALSLNPNEGAKKDKTREALQEALFGPWRYKDDQHSFGWDPSTVKLGAFTYKAPTKMANTGVRAAVWLAFESMPLFPVFAQGRQQRTRAFIQEGKQKERKVIFCWPIWSPFITLYELDCLLASAALVGNDNKAKHDLKSRGLVAIYRSEKFKPNKYMVTFRSAELVYSASL